MKKLTLIAAVLLCLSLSLTACTSYRNDVAVTDLTSSVLEVVSTYDGFVAADADYISLEFANPSVIESNVSEWTICASKSQITVDEFGIFLVKNGGDVNAVKAEVETYVQMLQVKMEAFLEMYDPAEKTKLENAQVFVFGDYVVFTMLTDADTTAATGAIKTALEK